MNKEQVCHDIAIAMTASLHSSLVDNKRDLSEAAHHFHLLQRYKTSYQYLLENFDSIPAIKVRTEP